MIIFFAKHPRSKPTQGMHHRILSIDNLFSDKKRIYIQVSFFRNFKHRVTQINDFTVQHELNFLVHFFLLKRLFQKGTLIYIHTVINGLKILPLLNTKNKNVSILDMHGVVPEESAMTGEVIKKRLFSFAERFCISKVNYTIHVSRAMKEHFDNKYPYRKNKDIILPIFERIAKRQDRYQKHRDYKLLVYVGGVQKWQNFDEVFYFALKNAGEGFYFNFMIPRNSVEQYNNKIPLELKKFISITNGDRKAVFDLLGEADYGFLLRDDILVNNVACPTKVIEYLHFGVIPIVKNNKIGDINYYGVKTITLDRFESMDLNKDQLETIDINNKAYFEMINDTDVAINQLKRVYADECGNY